MILLGVGARIALDPADHGYYTAGLLLGALLWDAVGTHRPIPLWTLTSFAALTAVHALTHDSALLGQLRLGLVIAFTAAILFSPQARAAGGSPGPDQAPPEGPLAGASALSPAAKHHRPFVIRSL